MVGALLTSICTMTVRRLACIMGLDGNARALGGGLGGTVVWHILLSVCMVISSVCAGGGGGCGVGWGWVELGGTVARLAYPCEQQPRMKPVATADMCVHRDSAASSSQHGDGRQCTWGWGGGAAFAVLCGAITARTNASVHRRPMHVCTADMCVHSGSALSGKQHGDGRQCTWGWGGVQHLRCFVAQSRRVQTPACSVCPCMCVLLACVCTVAVLCPACSMGMGGNAPLCVLRRGGGLFTHARDGEGRGTAVVVLGSTITVHTTVGICHRLSACAHC